MALRAIKPTPMVMDPGDQVVVLHGIPWGQYVALNDAAEGSPGVRMTYLDGVLQLMSPGRPHEFWKKLIARLVEIWALERGVSLNGFGNETFREESKKAGLEPDECYFVGPRKRFPDLAIEVASKHGSIDKLEVYRRLGVREVWFWTEGRIQMFRYTRSGYRGIRRSRVLPDIDVNEIARIVGATDYSKQTEAVRAYRRALRARR